MRSYNFFFLQLAFVITNPEDAGIPIINKLINLDTNCSTFSKHKY